MTDGWEDSPLGLFGMVAVWQRDLILVDFGTLLEVPG